MHGVLQAGLSLAAGQDRAFAMLGFVGLKPVAEVLALFRGNLRGDPQAPGLTCALEMTVEAVPQAVTQTTILLTSAAAPTHLQMLCAALSFASAAVNAALLDRTFDMDPALRHLNPELFGVYPAAPPEEADEAPKNFALRRHALLVGHCAFNLGFTRSNSQHKRCGICFCNSQELLISKLMKSKRPIILYEICSLLAYLIAFVSLITHMHACLCACVFVYVCTWVLACIRV